MRVGRGIGPSESKVEIRPAFTKCPGSGGAETRGRTGTAPPRSCGRYRTRTCEASGTRFTVGPRCRLSNLPRKEIIERKCLSRSVLLSSVARIRTRNDGTKPRRVASYTTTDEPSGYRIRGVSGDARSGGCKNPVFTLLPSGGGRETLRSG